MIISASRRTDIPAFYSDSFMNALRAGFILVKNPFNFQNISKIILSPKDIDLIVFWTKDPRPLMRYLDEIDGLGYKYYFQFTITPYGRDIEKNIADKNEIIEAFKSLSKKIGFQKVILRYDPVLINGKYDLFFHFKAFERLIEKLSGYTQRVVFSFLDFYRKTEKNLKGGGAREITTGEMRQIAETFSNITSKQNLSLETCAEGIDLQEFGIKHSKCIDGDLIEKILGRSIADKNKKDDNRLYCGCMKSKDIGSYNTCRHFCLYCYANAKVNQ
ncbi:MAG: DUF1848 domain-containing protein [Elusimicrobiota bacterium]|jgi:DNA repair photolyase|nr:DUF1848 domain-containing protein [Elusimicrobiota bacterium]